MRIADVIRRKGTDVVTVHPDSSVAELLALLAEHRTGAVVVSADGSAVGGIVSERDSVRHLHTDGAALLDAPVSQIMTAEVHTCAPDEVLDTLEAAMTERRIRHVPAVTAASDGSRGRTRRTPARMLGRGSGSVHQPSPVPAYRGGHDRRRPHRRTVAG
ncbi:MAG: CBS domain-containing protein [Nocardioides sp.]